MKNNVLLKGKLTSVDLSIDSSSLSLTATLTVYDPYNGVELLSALTTTPDITYISGVVINRGSDQFAAGLTQIGEYVLSYSGKTKKINVISIDSGICTVDTIFREDSDSATINGCKFAVSLTISGTYDQNSVVFKWVLSDGNQFNEEYLTVKQALINPVTAGDLVSLYPKLSNSEVDLSVMLQNILIDLRNRFWLDGVVMDHVRSGLYLKKLITLEAVKTLIEAGDNVTLTDDLYTAKKDFAAQARNEYQKVLASGIWIDTEEDNKISDGEKLYKGVDLIW